MQQWPTPPSLICNVLNVSVSHGYVQIIEHTNRDDKTISDLLNSAMRMRSLPHTCVYLNGQMDQYATLLKHPKLYQLDMEIRH